jgi:hypothetical protein
MIKKNENRRFYQFLYVNYFRRYRIKEKSDFFISESEESDRMFEQSNNSVLSTFHLFSLNFKLVYF